MKLFLTVGLAGIAVTSFSQIEFPALSPEGRIIQKIGYTNFTIRYDRPAARERKVMGALVPYDKMWRTGAGKCTTIQFDHPVKINGQDVQPGIYALATIPSLQAWTILLNADTSRIYGQASDYEQKTEAVRFLVKSKSTSRFYESLTMDFDIRRDNGVFCLSWENTQVSFPIETNADVWAEQKIQTGLKENPNDAETLSRVAFYYEMNNKKLGEAYRCVKKAMTLKEDRWF